MGAGGSRLQLTALHRVQHRTSEAAPRDAKRPARVGVRAEVMQLKGWRKKKACNTQNGSMAFSRG